MHKMVVRLLSEFQSSMKKISRNKHIYLFQSRDFYLQKVPEQKDGHPRKTSPKAQCGFMPS